MPALSLPRPEIDSFLLTVGLAAQLAGEGDPADGYAALEAGLRSAELALADHRPWGPELVARWQRALDHYAQRHGLTRSEGQHRGGC